MAYLALLANGHLSQSFSLRGEVQIGRDKNNSVVVSDQKVSRHHATLTHIDDAYIISDKGSANGTFLNGVLITQPARLKDNDQIIVGDTHFLFTQSEPHPDAISKVVAASQNISPQASVASPSLFNNNSIWMIVGCLGLAVVGLLIVVALLFGLFLGQGQLGVLTPVVTSSLL